MSVVFSSLDKKSIRQSFASAAETYDELAALQRQVGVDLLNRFELDMTGQTIMDIGCGTGFLTQALMQETFNQKMIAVDIAFSMLEVSRLKLQKHKNVQYICADAEQLPLSKQSVDVIYSNLALQWCQNLTQVFSGFKNVLKQQGKIVFSTFGPATLKELKQAWSEVDDYKHVNEFYTTDELCFFLQQTGFDHIKIESKYYQSNYQAVIELMRELKGIGARNVLTGRNKNMTSKNQMKNMIAAYEKFRINGFIPATNEIIFVSASVAK